MEASPASADLSRPRTPLTAYTLRIPHPHRWKCTQTECVAPRTIGEHLKNRRLALHLFQKDVAQTFGVDMATLQGWERGLWKPIPKYYPAIIRFLGYVPFSHDGSPGGQFRFLRLCAGLSQEDLAGRLGCALTTIWRWESNHGGDTNMQNAAFTHLNAKFKKLELYCLENERRI